MHFKTYAVFLIVFSFQAATIYSNTVTEASETHSTDEFSFLQLMPIFYIWSDTIAISDMYRCKDMISKYEPLEGFWETCNEYLSEIADDLEAHSHCQIYTKNIAFQFVKLNNVSDEFLGYIYNHTSYDREQIEAMKNSTKKIAVDISKNNETLKTFCYGKELDKIYQGLNSCDREFRSIVSGIWSEHEKCKGNSHRKRSTKTTQDNPTCEQEKKDLMAENEMLTNEMIGTLTLEDGNAQKCIEGVLTEIKDKVNMAIANYSGEKVEKFLEELGKFALEASGKLIDCALRGNIQWHEVVRIINTWSELEPKYINTMKDRFYGLYNCYKHSFTY